MREGHEAVYLTQSWLRVCFCCGVESVTADVFSRLQRLSLSRTLPPSLEWSLELSLSHALGLDTKMLPALRPTLESVIMGIDSGEKADSSAEEIDSSDLAKRLDPSYSLEGGDFSSTSHTFVSCETL